MVVGSAPQWRRRRWLRTLEVVLGLLIALKALQTLRLHSQARLGAQKGSRCACVASAPISGLC